MRKRTTILFAVVTTIIFIMNSTVLAATEDTLDIYLYKQAKNFWCWATVNASIINYTGHNKVDWLYNPPINPNDKTNPVTQWEVVQRFFGRMDTENLPDVPLDPLEVKTSLQQWGVTTTFVNNTGLCSPSLIRSNISGPNRSPIFAIVSNDSSSDHAVLIYGYYDDDSIYDFDFKVYYQDPWPEYDLYNIERFSEFYRDGSKYWKYALANNY